MFETYYLGIDFHWIAHLLSLWNDSGLELPIEISRSRKTKALVVAKITINNTNYEEIQLLNRIWKETGCKIHKV